MAIVNYRPLSQNPNYLMLPKSPGGIEPNKTGGKIASGIADILEQGIKSADEIQKQYVDKQSRDVFDKINKEQEDEYKRQIGENDTKLGNPNGSSGGSEYYTGDLGGSPSAIPVQKVDTGVSGTSTGGAEGALPEGSAPVQYTDDTAPGYPKLEDQPGPIQSELKKQININQATEQGKFHDTGRQMEGEKALSSLKAQFPGRTKEIDALAAHYGITYNKGVTTLQGLLNDQQTQLRQKQSKDEAFEEKNRGWFIGDPASGRPGIAPNYFQLPEDFRRSPAVRNRLEAEIGAMEGILKKNEVAQSQLAMKNSTIDDKVKETKALMASDMQVRMSAGILGIMRQSGYSGGGEDIGKAMNDFTNQLANNKNKEQLENLQTQLGNYMTSFIANEHRLANQRIIHSDGTTALGRIGPDEVTRLAQGVLMPVQGIRENITNPQSGMLTAYGRMATTAANEAQYKISQHPMYQETETAGYLRKQYGDDVFRQYYEKQPVDPKTGVNPMSIPMQSLMNAAKLSVGYGTKNPVTNSTLKFSDTINDATNTFKLYGGNVPPAKDVNGMLESLHQGIMNEKLPVEVRARFADSIFSDPKLPSMLKPEDTFTFLQKYAQPNVGEQIYKFGNPQLTQDYEKTMLNVSKMALNEKIGNLKEAQSTFFSDKYISENMAYNAKTNRVDAVVPSTQDIYNKFGPARGVVLDYQASKIRDAVPVINQTLSFLDPIFKREGAEKVGPAIFNTILGAGIPIKGMEEGPSTETNKEGKSAKALPNVDVTSPKSLETQGAGGLAGAKGFAPNATLTSTLPPEYLTPTNDVTGKNAPIQPTPVPTQTIQGPQGRFEELQGQPSRDKRSELPADSQLASFSAEAPSASGSAGVQAINAATSTNPIKDILRKAEGVKGASGYNTVYGGDRYNLTNMTVSEVQQLQSTLPKDQRAVGAGQFIPKTLNSLVREMGLKGDEKFTPELQEKMIDTLLERRGYSQWKAGKMSDDTFINKLSEEWAGLPNSTGVSAYQGVAGNKATVSLASVKRALGRHRGE